MTNTHSKDIPAILLVDSSGFDGSSQPDDISVQEALEMLNNRHQKRETLAQKAIFSVDCSGFDGGSQPDHIIDAAADRILRMRREELKARNTEKST